MQRHSCSESTSQKLVQIINSTSLTGIIRQQPTLFSPTIMMTLRPPSPNMHWQHIFCAHSLCMKSVVHATPSRQLTTQKQRCTPPQCTTTAQQGSNGGGFMYMEMCDVSHTHHTPHPGQQASSLYDIPELYEQAFGFRNVEDEVLCMGNFRYCVRNVCTWQQHALYTPSTHPQHTLDTPSTTPLAPPQQHP